MLFILSNRLDFAVDHTILRLEQRGIPFLRLNSEDLTDARFAFAIRDGNVRRTLGLLSRSVDVDEVTAVWLRRQLQPSLRQLAPEQRAFAATEWRYFLDAFLATDVPLWVNSPAATFRAERKVHVLERALSLGFSVPETIVTNDPDRFRAHVDAGWIAKPLYQGILSVEGQAHAVYTHRISEFGEIADAEVRACPCIYQREIPRGRDLRVTVVGDRVFGASVHADSTRDVDWRRPESGARFERTELSSDLVQRCLTLMKDLGLTYGAFDFIEDPEGTPWFLEVNPAGEFAWLEVQLGFPIRDAFLDLFEAAARR